jgi:hypothetical protein
MACIREGKLNVAQPNGGFAVPDYRTTSELSIVNNFSFVFTVKKQPQLSPWISAVRSKKQNSSITYATDYRAARSQKTLCFHVKSVHCFRILFK